MSVDAYSPITGRWGIEGVWDVAFVGLTIAALGVLVMVLATRHRDRFVGLLGVLTLPPTLMGAKWLGDLGVLGRDQTRLDCLLQGPVNASSDCGAAYLDRYTLLMTPVTLWLIALSGLAVFVVRARLVQRLATSRT